MKTIVMLRNGPGSPDGLNVVQYERGVRYVVPTALAQGFERVGYARIEADVAPEPVAPPVQAPAIAEASDPAPADAAFGPPAPAAKPAKATRRPRNLSGSQDRSLSAKD